MSLNINKDAGARIVQDSIRSFPDECCGFLFGTETGDERTVSEILIVGNSKEGDKRRRFEIKPLDYLRAEQYAETNDLRLLGIYHSHPDHPSVPSEHDRVAAQPYFSYVIVSVYAGQYKSLQSWRLNDDAQFEEETVLQNKIPITNNLIITWPQ